MPGEEFDVRNKASWIAAIKKAFGVSPPLSARWNDRKGILPVLKPFMGQNLNHTMLPGSGGYDMESIALSPESGCLEFGPGKGTADTFRPGDLYFEYFPDSPWNSFFLLDTQPLEPCGVYETNDGEYEEVVEISPGEYIDRSHHDTGVLDHDENGHEIPLPPTARIISRHMQGKFLVVAKRSFWNRVTETYDGRHNRMTAGQIRQQIQNAVDQHPEPPQL